MRSPTKSKQTMQYRRVYIANGTYFFTVNLFERKQPLLIDHIDQLRLSFSQVKLNHPYNPVKHGYVKNPMDWQYSSIHYYITKGILPANWAADLDKNDSFEE
ncbi:hypothetical protein CbuK_0397 [Coxiella burnetii CbuK_Q154]|nr:hypothetical protein [Coxiella burnetii]ACJ19686.1 hypothetical protein CbuK_0397 [Coxiella burnetii CbuK_Q154]UYK69913.1 hypothetical protein OHM78_01020 [Coxiella burnetii]